MQSDSRLTFYYIQALCGIGQFKEAYEIMEKDDGLVLDDLREGEDSLSDLWKLIHKEIYGEDGEVPYRYQFMAFE